MNNSKDKLIGINEKAKEGDIVELEIVLRLEQKEKRTLKYFISEREQTIFFTHLPSSVQFAVFFSFLLMLFCYFNFCC